LIGCY